MGPALPAPAASWLTASRQPQSVGDHVPRRGRWVMPVLQRSVMLWLQLLLWRTLTRQPGGRLPGRHAACLAAAQGNSHNNSVWPGPRSLCSSSSRRCQSSWCAAGPHHQQQRLLQQHSLQPQMQLLLLLLQAPPAGRAAHQHPPATAHRLWTRCLHAWMAAAGPWIWGQYGRQWRPGRSLATAAVCTRP